MNISSFSKKNENASPAFHSRSPKKHGLKHITWVRQGHRHVTQLLLKSRTQGHYNVVGPRLQSLVSGFDDNKAYVVI